MTCGCAMEPIGREYRQYPDNESKWCTGCNRIFCLEHAKIHGKRLKKNRMLPMQYTPELWAKQQKRKAQHNLSDVRGK